MIKTAAAVLALMLMGLAAPAHASDISCAWTSLPAGVRANFERLARSPRPESALDLIDDPARVDAIKACKFTTVNGPRYVMAMGGLLNQRLAEVLFQGRFTPEQLNAAWRRVDPALVSAAVTTRAKGFDQAAGTASIEALARQLNVPASDARGRALVLVYANGRITRAYGEAGF